MQGTPGEAPSADGGAPSANALRAAVPPYNLWIASVTAAAPSAPSAEHLFEADKIPAAATASSPELRAPPPEPPGSLFVRAMSSDADFQRLAADLWSAPGFHRARRVSRARGDATVLARYLSERAGDDPDADRALAAHSAAVLEMVNSDDAVDEDGACKELRVLWPLYECTAIALRAAHDALAQEQRRSSELRRQLAQARGAATLRRAGLQPSGDDDDDDDDAAAEADHALPAPAPLLTVATDARAWADSVLLELHAPHENGGICGGGGGGGGGGAAAALQEHSAKRQSSRIRRTHLDGTEDAAAGLAALQDE